MYLNLDKCHSISLSERQLRRHDVDVAHYGRRAKKYENWNLARDRKPLKRIEPLE
jgi:hypothetical protein